MSTCKWPLGNGQTLEFEVCDLNTTWRSVAGLYIFARDLGKYWSALYVGKTTDFNSRLPSHERWEEAIENGMTHIHAVVVPQATNRNHWEQMLIERLEPPMNDQLNR